MEITDPQPYNSVPTLPKRLILPIIRQCRRYLVSTEDELKKAVKMNSKSLLNFESGPYLFDSSFGFAFNQPAVQNNNRKRTPARLIRLRKIANLLQHKKLIPNLIYDFQPTNSSEMDFVISKLKVLHYSTSLDLDLSSVKLCNPQHLKSLSLILSHFKKLNSLIITFPRDIKNSHELLSALFHALSRLKSLQCLSLNFHHIRITPPTMTSTLQKCLKKVPQLKSLALTISDGGRVAETTLRLLPTYLKKLPLLQSLDIDLLDSGSVLARTLQTFFQELQDLKSFKNLTLSVADPKAFMSFIPLKKGSAKIPSSQEKIWRIRYDAVQYDDPLDHLAEAIQISPFIQQLNLDFTQSYCLSDCELSQICSSIQNLHSLTSLQFNFSEAKKIISSAQMIGNALKPLVKLRSLDLNFSGLQSTDDAQLTSLAAGLHNLSELTSLKLDLSYLERLTNQGIEILSFAIGRLIKLEDLSLTLAGNGSFNKQGMDFLAKALEKLTSLSLITLQVKECHHLKGEENYVEIHKALDQLKFLKSRIIRIPKIEEDPVGYGGDFGQRIIWG